MFRFASLMFLLIIRVCLLLTRIFLLLSRVFRQKFVFERNTFPHTPKKTVPTPQKKQVPHTPKKTARLFWGVGFFLGPPRWSILLRTRFVYSGVHPGAMTKLSPLARVSRLTGARNKAPVNPDPRASGPSFATAPGVRHGSTRLCRLERAPLIWGLFELEIRYSAPDFVRWGDTMARVLCAGCP